MNTKSLIKINCVILFPFFKSLLLITSESRYGTSFKLLSCQIVENTWRRQLNLLLLVQCLVPELRVTVPFFTHTSIFLKLLKKVSSVKIDLLMLSLTSLIDFY